MKKYLFCITFLFCHWVQAIDVSVNHATFKGPEQNYAEVYLLVVGSTVAFTTPDSHQYQAAIEVLMLFKKGDEIVSFEKYKLETPLVSSPINFVDMKRFGLENGAYVLEVTVTDLNKVNNSKTYTREVLIGYDKKQLMLSDIMMLGSLRADSTQGPMVKNGFYMENLPFNFYTKEAEKLMFYVEIYNSDKVLNESYLIRYIIEKVKGNGTTKAVMLGNKKRQPKAVDVLLLQKDITKLASGNYNLIVEVRNQKSELLTSKKAFFQRSNPYLHEALISTAPLEKEFVSSMTFDELRYGLKAIAPIVDDASVEPLNIVLGAQDTLAHRRMLFSFWVKQNPNNPKAAYEKYMEVAKAVDKTYKSGFGFGFETDRGWTFMKYGKPDNMISVEDEPSAPPYEIWFYNTIPLSRQKNVKFLFYNPSLAYGDYKLLHSTARGEINNPQWEIELYRDDPNTIQSSDINSISAPAGLNRNARRYFEDY